MTASTDRFADVEAALVTHLGALDGVAGAATKAPADLLDQLPFHRVQRTGGADDDMHVTDVAVVDVDTFASDYGVSRDFAEAARIALRDLRNQVVAGRLFDQVTTMTAPIWVDWGDEHVQRFVATYRITSRITATR